MHSAARALPKRSSYLQSVRRRMWTGVGATVVVATVAAAYVWLWSSGSAPLPSTPAGSLSRLTLATARPSGVQVEAVACTGPGNCVIGGAFTQGRTYGAPSKAFVEIETDGVWDPPFEIRGATATVADGGAAVDQISCPEVGACEVLGSDGLGTFVATQEGNHWSSATQLPIYAAAIACAAPDECTVAGNTEGAAPVAVVERELHDAWQPAVRLRGVPSGTNLIVDVFPLSCTSLRTCTVAGFVSDVHDVIRSSAFVDSEVNGTWLRAQTPRGPAAHAGRITTLTCSANGACLAGGFSYTGPVLGGLPRRRGFIVEEVGGRWGRSHEPVGLRALDTGFGSVVSAASCSAPGDCLIGGHYRTRAGGYESFVSTEHDGRWGPAIEVPGTVVMNAGAAKFVQEWYNDVEIGSYNSGVHSISCARSGTCIASGVYVDDDLDVWPYVAIERNGRWEPAERLTGLRGFAPVPTMKFANLASSIVGSNCAPDGACIVVGNSSPGFGPVFGTVSYELRLDLDRG